MTHSPNIEEIIQKDHYKIALQELIVREHDRLERLEEKTNYDQLREYYSDKQIFCFRLLEFVQEIE
jgi:hypothetical protein